MSPKHKFAEGEKVLCFHGPLIYEAKALKCTVTKDRQIKYYIHYAGWNKNWDEWVPENRVLKYNDVNVQKQHEVYRQHSSTSGKSKKGTPKNKKIDTSAILGKDGGASSGGSESRASTPSKDEKGSGSGPSLAAPSSASTGGGRANRSKQPANTPTTPANKDADAAGTASANAVSATVSTANKRDESREDIAKEDQTNSSSSALPAAANKDEQHQPKKKRGGSASTASEKSTGSSSASAVSAGPASSSSATATTPTTPQTPGNRLDSCVESEETFSNKIEVKIKIPDELKQCLTDDWDAITRQHKLIDIPAKITVQDIVDQYIAYKKTSKMTNATKEVAINDFLNGVVEYFNVMLGSQLLYKFERPQYAEILQQHPDTPVSKLYGSFHLLRLFVKLGSMLGYSALDEKAMQMLLVHLHDFLKFLVKNSTTHFSMTNFINVSPEYHRNTQ